MAYCAEISRSQPGCILFLIDQSGSMSAPFGADNSISKAQGLSDALNRLLQNIIIRCTRSDGVRNYFEIGVLGYGRVSGVGSALSGPLAGRDLVTVEDLENNPLRIEERKGTVVGDHPVAVTTRLPIWVEPIAEGLTPMCEALTRAHGILSQWTSRHPASYPPIVIHISDGGATDGDPVPVARKILDLSTTDGNALVFNCHVSDEGSAPVLFPSSDPRLPDPLASVLYAMSSELPPAFAAEAVKEGFRAEQGSRGFGFNADLVALIQFIEIGTSSLR